MKKTLFLDYDGVLHPYDVYATGGDGEPELHCEDKSLALFCFAPILEAILDDIDPAGRIKIVLSTTWAQRTHWTLARNHLPDSLKNRVVSATHPAPVARGIQIELHAMDFGIPDDSWTAIDDDNYGWPVQHLDKLVKCNPHLGISCPKTQKELREKLERLLK
jgi:hypothetical protein